MPDLARPPGARAGAQLVTPDFVRPTMLFASKRRCWSLGSRGGKVRISLLCSPHMAKRAGILSRLRNRGDYFAPSIARCPDDTRDAKVESQDSNSSAAFSRPTTTTVRYHRCRLPLATWHRRRPGGRRPIFLRFLPVQILRQQRFHVV
jgi:hypothetical protein